MLAHLRKYSARIKAQLVARFVDHKRPPYSIAQLLGSSTQYALLPIRVRKPTATELDRPPTMAVAVPAQGPAVAASVAVAVAVRPPVMILTENETRYRAQRLIDEYEKAKVNTRSLESSKRH